MLTLNRERVAAGLSFLIMVFGLWGILHSRLSVPPPRIATDPPPSTVDIPRSDPRLYLEDAGGERNPFLLATDWSPITPEGLEPPTPEPSRWLAVPLARGRDPADSGFLYLREPPVEVKAEEEEKKEEPAAGGSQP